MSHLTPRQLLKQQGAPTWILTAETFHAARFAKIDRRLDAVEQAVLTDAAKRGASAGRRWGALLGTVIAAAVSTGFTQCAIMIPPNSQRPAAAADHATAAPTNDQTPHSGAAKPSPDSGCTTSGCSLPRNP